MVEKLKRYRTQRQRHAGEDGLALLDVLIGMAIFALVAVIAVSAISQYRARAIRVTLMSDLQQIHMAVEDYYSQHQAYPGMNGGGFQSLYIDDPSAGLLQDTSNGAFATWLDSEVNLSPGVGAGFVYALDYERLAPNEPAYAGARLFQVCISHKDGGAATLLLNTNPSFFTFDMQRGLLLDAVHCADSRSDLSVITY